MSQEIGSPECELPIQRDDGVQRVMDRDVHHGVCANALKGKELVLGKCDFIDGLIPCHNQSRIQEEDMLQLGERRVLLLSRLLVRKALSQIRLARLLRRSVSCE